MEGPKQIFVQQTNVLCQESNGTAGEITPEQELDHIFHQLVSCKQNICKVASSNPTHTASYTTSS